MILEIIRLRVCGKTPTKKERKGEHKPVAQIEVSTSSLVTTFLFLFCIPASNPPYVITNQPREQEIFHEVARMQSCDLIGKFRKFVKILEISKIATPLFL